MKKVQIITDSCSDLTPELMERYSIDYAQMNTVYEGKTAPADLSWTAQDVHKFYDIMRNGGRITTTQVPVEEFNRVFRKYLDQDCDIVYIGCSLKQSGSVNTASVLAKKLTEEYPGSTIRCINSLRASMGIGMLAIEAAKFAENGTTADEVAEYINVKLNHLHEFCTAHTLDHLKRAGRVKASSAFFGNLFGVKPIIVADADGEQAAYKKVKGRSASLSEIVSLLKEHIRDAENQTVYLAHADCSQDEVEKIKEMIRREIPCKEIYVGYIGPIIGASIGPDAVAVFAFGDEQTFRIGEK
ncbi:MAG: DegV family protein [Clostridia bacterium]|nr:DegV family protein [Clostridia bacterium]